MEAKGLVCVGSCPNYVFFNWFSPQSCPPKFRDTFLQIDKILMIKKIIHQENGKEDIFFYESC